MTDVPPLPVPPPSPQPGPLAHRRLTRSRSDRMVAGVCAGIARYLGVDPALIRIGTVVLVFAGGSAILAYIIAVIVIPEDEDDDGEQRAGIDLNVDPAHMRFFIGGALVVAGVLWLLSSILPWIFNFRAFGALFLIALGVLLVIQSSRR